MTTPSMLDKLTLPEALMAFLHNDEGQVFQSARPKQSTAAAELGELIIEDHLVASEDGTMSAKSSGPAPKRPWMTDVLAQIGTDRQKIDAWVRGRRDALSVQQDAAVEQGVLHKDRAKLAGLIGYDRYMVDDAVRTSLLEELVSAEASKKPRAVALAMLLATPAVMRVNRFETDQVERIKSLGSEGTTPLPGPLFSTLQYGIATAIGISILND